MLKKFLACTLLSTAISGCGIQFEPAFSGTPCRPGRPCVERNQSDVYAKLENQKPNESAAISDAPVPAPLPEATAEDEQIFLAAPIEPIEGLGIEGRRLSPDVAVAVSTGTYKKTGHAKPIIGDGIVTYPYGIGESKVTCIPLHACLVEFQPGESVSNIVIGDSENWGAEAISEGDKDMVVLKTLYAADTATNMVVTSNRRIYNITLVSKDSGAYTPRVNFYYPQDSVVFSRKQKQEEERIKAIQTPTFASGVADLNFDYELEDTKGKPWAPVRVFDDGRKVYIQMKKSMDVTEAPVLFEKSKKGELSIVNYRVQGQYYIVDKLFKEAVLKLGEDDKEMVTIERKA